MKKALISIVLLGVINIFAFANTPSVDAPDITPYNHGMDLGER